MLTIDQVRSIVSRLEFFYDGIIDEKATRCPDAEQMLMIDQCTDFKMFFVEDAIYTRNELYARWAFSEMKITPEDVFSRQVLGYFGPADGWVSRDEDRESKNDYGPARHVIRLALGRGGPPMPEPIREVRTKIFIARERWSDFVATERVMRGMLHVRSVAQFRLTGGKLPIPALTGGGGLPIEDNPADD